MGTSFAVGVTLGLGLANPNPNLTLALTLTPSQVGVTEHALQLADEHSLPCFSFNVRDPTVSKRVVVSEW